MTVEAWIKPVSNTAFGSIGGSLDGGAVNGWGFFLSDNVSTKLAFQFVGGEVNNSTAISAGVWTHAAVTIDGTNAKFYVNGTLDGTTANTSTVSSSSQTVWVGAYALSGAGSGYWNGNIGLFRVWNSALSGATINANKCSVMGATTGLLAEWTLDNVLTDNSGNSLTLTNHGTATFQADVTNSCTVAATDEAYTRRLINPFTFNLPASVIVTK